MKQLGYQYDDGGRYEAGWFSLAGDCFCRAVSIAMDRPYAEVYDEINRFAKENETPSRTRRGKSTARNGYHNTTGRAYLISKGWKWTPTMHIGQGCQVHMNADELPTEGPMILNVSKHWVAVVDGVVRDSHDPRRGGKRCVYGYLTPPSSNS